MNIELKLFRFQRWIRPEYGKDELKHESFVLATSIEKVKDYVYATHGIRLDESGKYCHWYEYGRCDNEFILKELECVLVLC